MKFVDLLVSVFRTTTLKCLNILLLTDSAYAGWKIVFRLPVTAAH